MRVEAKLLAAGTTVAPPECPACSQKASVLPPPPTISSSRARIAREPEVTTKSVTSSSSNDEDSSDSHESSRGVSSAKPSDFSVDNSDSGSVNNSNSGDQAKTDIPPVRFGPPKSKQQKPAKSVEVTNTVPDQGI
jgi:hypothetical protein